MKGQKKILLVDDDRVFLSEMKEFLVSAGYEIIDLFDSKSVVAIAQKVKPDLIVLDIKMEDMDGFEIAIDLKRTAETAHTPIIAVSGFYTSEDYNEMFDLCSIETLVKKPFNPSLLLREVENALQHA